MVKTTCNAAISIATRNATFKVVPRAFVSLIQDEADRVARGDVKSLPQRVERAVTFFTGRGVSEERIYAALGVAGPADITLDQLQRLNGLKVALSEGHGTLEDLFPVPTVAADAPPAGSSKAETLASRIKGKPATGNLIEAPEPGSDG